MLNEVWFPSSNWCNIVQHFFCCHVWTTKLHSYGRVLQHCCTRARAVSRLPGKSNGYFRLKFAIIIRPISLISTIRVCTVQHVAFVWLRSRTPTKLNSTMLNVVFVWPELKGEENFTIAEFYKSFKMSGWLVLSPVSDLSTGRFVGRHVMRDKESLAYLCMCIRHIPVGRLFGGRQVVTLRNIVEVAKQSWGRLTFVPIVDFDHFLSRTFKYCQTCIG